MTLPYAKPFEEISGMHETLFLVPELTKFYYL